MCDRCGKQIIRETYDICTATTTDTTAPPKREYIDLDMAYKKQGYSFCPYCGRRLKGDNQ